MAFASKLFQNHMANHYAFKLVLGHKDFPKDNDKLSPTDWKTMQEMEAIYSRITVA